MKTETLELTVLSDNKELQTNLEKENITELVINDLKTKYSGLEIKGMDDVAGYKAVDEGRKEVKRIRVMAEKIVKTETDKAFQAHKLAVADGKKVVARFTEIEAELEKKQAVIDDAKKLIEEKAAEGEKAKNAQRVRDLQAFNYQGDLLSIEFITDEQFAVKLEGVKADYEAEQARIKEEKFLSDWDAAIVENQVLINAAETKRLQAERDKMYEQKIKLRSDRLVAIGLNKSHTCFFFYGVTVTNSEIEKSSDEDFETLFKFTSDKLLKEKEAIVENEKIEKINALKTARFEKLSLFGIKDENYGDLGTITDAEFETALETQKGIYNAAQKAAQELADAEKEKKEKAENERKEALKTSKERMKYWVENFTIGKPAIDDNETIDSICEKFNAFKTWAQKQVDSLS